MSVKDSELKALHSRSLASIMSTMKHCVFSLLVMSLLEASAASEQVLPQTFELESPTLLPESFDWDPAHNRFLLGSASQATIFELTSGGDVREFVRDEECVGQVSVGGVKVDRKRNRVVVAVNDVVNWNYSGVAAYDLDSKKRVYLARLEKLGVAEGEKSCADDIAIDSRSGDAYITNSAGNFLWKITASGTPSVFLKHSNFTSQPTSPLLSPSSPSRTGLNGIVYEPRLNSLLAVQTSSGALFRIGIDDQSVHPVHMKHKLPGADGMALRDDGTLVVVSKARVWLVGSASDWMAANAVDAVALDDGSEYAIAVAMKKGSAFVVRSSADEGFEARQIAFPAENREEHPVWLVVAIVAVVVAVSVWRFQVAYLYGEYRRKTA